MEPIIVTPECIDNAFDKASAFCGIVAGFVSESGNEALTVADSFNAVVLRHRGMSMDARGMRRLLLDLSRKAVEILEASN